MGRSSGHGPGPMSVLLNNLYVPKTEVSKIATGDTFRCTIGMGTSVRVSHELIESATTSLQSSFVEQCTAITFPIA